MRTRQIVPKSFAAVTTSPADTNVAVFSPAYSYVTTLVLHAPEANTSDVMIGGAELDGTNGIPLAPGQTFTMAVDPTGAIEKLKVSDLYVRSATLTDTVRVFALVGE